ncbi:MAG TPA: hypothetical protein VH186_24675 [Chloroflexia bacterium]|nr:hypothetical protein [Chloroflexia bacterium]
MDPNLIGTIIAIILTIMVYTYLIGENVIFRIAEHILVGVSVGWAILQIYYNLLVPGWNNINAGISSGQLGETLAFLIPAILGIIMLTRPFRASKSLTNLIMALVIGTVAALSLAGALSGTLLPQIGASMLPLNGGDVFGRVILLIGTLVSLWYFQFTLFKTKRGDAEVTSGSALAGLNERVRVFGRWSIMLAFGAIFASVFLTYFAALLDRLLFLINLKF